MLFNSIDFLVFFPIVTTLYFLLPHRWRVWLLLVASVYFYMSFVPAYIFILLITILIDYSMGLLIENAIGRTRKIYLVISIVSTCFVLFIFKYFNFFVINFDAFSHFFRWNYSLDLMKIILPIGLSFHTFQSLSYVIEVYWGRQKAERRFSVYSLYVMFYPQLVAGPIERPQNLLHQFDEKHYFDYSQLVEGLKLMLWGFLMKVVIADRLALYVNSIYSHLPDYGGPAIILATVFFAFQIYCDFAGYSLIAIGAARTMGFRLMENFRQPYQASSIADFWRRWHISLSTWFKDYLYIPLGGNRLGYWRSLLNIFIVFLVSGLWHGASWTFVAWGAIHGLYRVVGAVTQNVRTRIVSALGILKYPRVYRLWQTTFVFALVCLAWIFFRASSIGDAFYAISHIFSGWHLDSFTDITVFGRFRFALMAGSVILLVIVQFLESKKIISNFLAKRSNLIKWPLYISVILVILLLGVFNKDFIYFQF